MAKRPVARDYFSDRDDSGDIKCEDVSRAVQAARDECDINVIVKKYLRTGELPAARQAIYADISSMGNLQDALHMVDAAESAFMELPADVRRYFDNDPVKLVAFAQDPRNQAKAVELGLATWREKDAPPASQKAPAGADPAPSQPAKAGPN